MHALVQNLCVSTRLSLIIMRSLCEYVQQDIRPTRTCIVCCKIWYIFRCLLLNEVMMVRRL